MSNDLVDPSDLEDFPGSPFPQTLVDAAVAGLQNEAGWHIAPSVTQTITVNHQGGTRVVLPSRRVTDVSEVRDVSGSTPRKLTGWRFTREGLLVRGWWPTGLAVLEVDLEHGYEETPADLLPVLADLCHLASMNKTASTEAAQPFQVQRTDLDKLRSWQESGGTLDFYTVRAGF